METRTFWRGKSNHFNPQIDIPTILIFLFHERSINSIIHFYRFFRRPLNNKPNGTTVDIQIHQRYFWDRLWTGFSIDCTEADVVSKTLIPVSGNVYCYANCSSSIFPATGAGLSTVMTTTDCNPNPLIRSWAGERYNIYTLPLTTSITIGFYGNLWFVTNLYQASGQSWTLASRINLAVRPDGFINSSPVTNTLPVLFKPVGQQLVHVIQVIVNILF